MFLLSFRSLTSKDHQLQHGVALNLTLTETHLRTYDAIRPPLFCICGISLQHLSFPARMTVLLANFIQDVSTLHKSGASIVFSDIQVAEDTRYTT